MIQIDFVKKFMDSGLYLIDRALKFIGNYVTWINKKNELLNQARVAIAKRDFVAAERSLKEIKRLNALGAQEMKVLFPKIIQSEEYIKANKSELKEFKEIERIIVKEDQLNIKDVEYLVQAYSKSTEDLNLILQKYEKDIAVDQFRARFVHLSDVSVRLRFKNQSEAEVRIDEKLKHNIEGTIIFKSVCDENAKEIGVPEFLVLVDKFPQEASRYFETSRIMRVKNFTAIIQRVDLNTKKVVLHNYPGEIGFHKQNLIHAVEGSYYLSSLYQNASITYDNLMYVLEHWEGDIKELRQKIRQIRPVRLLYRMPTGIGFIVEIVDIDDKHVYLNFEKNFLKVKYKLLGEVLPALYGIKQSGLDKTLAEGLSGIHSLGDAIEKGDIAIRNLKAWGKPTQQIKTLQKDTKVLKKAA